jgi:hypothetical protein
MEDKMLLLHSRGVRQKAAHLGHPLARRDGACPVPLILRVLARHAQLAMSRLTRLHHVYSTLC